MLLRPSISNHYASLLTQTLMPVLERQIKDTLSSAFLQFHAQHSANLQQEMMRELRNELSVIKSDLGSWHGEALRSQEVRFPLLFFIQNLHFFFGWGFIGHNSGIGAHRPFVV